jgi:hypothetical protein
VITDKDVDDALHYLQDNADKAAKARAERLYLEEYRKSLKAQLQKEHVGDSIGAQEREAYDDPRYRDHLTAMRDAVFKDERERFLREAKLALIEAWRTQCSNERAKV